MAPFMDDTLLAGAYVDESVVTESRLAAMLTRRVANQHGCQPRCRHRNHRRDLHYLQTMLDVMMPVPGPYPPPRPEDYRQPDQ